MTEETIDLDRCIWDSDYRQDVKRRLNAPDPTNGDIFRVGMRVRLVRYLSGFSRRLYETT